MKRIATFAATLALMTLIGYGAAQAQETVKPAADTQADSTKEPQEANKPAGEKTDQKTNSTPTPSEMAQATKMEDSTKDFLGLKWGSGIGVMGSFGGNRPVEKASIVTKDGKNFVRVEEEGGLHPQLFLEMHVFLGGNAGKWRKYQRWKAANIIAKTTDGEKVAEKLPEEGMPSPPMMGFGPFIALQGSDKNAIDAFTLGYMWGFRKDSTESTSVNIGIGLSFDPSVQVLRGDLKDGAETTETEVQFKKESQFGWALMASFTF
jgi:hypothetical protein